MRSSRVVLSLLCAAAAFAQTPSGKPASISGVVINSVTNAPLPRVHLIFGLNSGEERTYGAMTTADGKFSITGMLPGSYSLTLERVGFSMPADNHAPENNPVVLIPDEVSNDLRLRLVPAGAVAGRVTNADGEPVEGATVSVDYAMAIPGESPDGITDAKGNFRIGGLAPGKYRVKAVPENDYTPAELRTDGTVDTEDAPTYYGSRVAVSAGGEITGVDIRLTRVPVVEVSGKLEGAPAGSFNPQLFVADANGGGRSSGAVKPDGTFRLWRLFPGKYEVSAMWQASGGRDFQSGAVPFEVAGANIDHLVLRLAAPANLTGHLEFLEDGAKPASGGAMRLTLMNVGLRGGGKPVDVVADGSFQVSQLRPGRYRVIPSWRGAYVASMQLGSVAIDGSLLDLSNGADGAALSVRLSAATGVVSGNVTDENGPVAGARVGLVFDGEGGGIRPRFAIAGPDGTYSFHNVAPGKYKLVAVQEADNDYVVQGGTLDAYADLMEAIEIHTGEKLTHDLKRREPGDK